MEAVITQRTFTNAEELDAAVRAMIIAAENDSLAHTGARLWSSEINCEFSLGSGRLVLVKQRLTDGSNVYNIELR